jgi:hypothetical protein
MLSQRPGFALTTIWYLAAVSVFVQLALALLLLRREFGRRLRFGTGAVADGTREAMAAGAVAAE